MPYRVMARSRLIQSIAVLFLLSLGVAACESGTTMAIKSVKPASGNISGNDHVVVHGRGFKPGMVVHFGESEVKSVVIDSPQRIRIRTPSGPEGKVDVVIIDEDGKSYVLKNGFTYTRQAAGS